MIRETFPVGMFACNCTILGCEETREAIVLDPGEEPDRVLEALRRHGLRPVQILHTHAHLDHVGGTSGIAGQAPAPARLHEDDLPLYTNVAAQAALFHLAAPPAPPDVDRFLRDGETIRFGRHEIEILHTPGHTPGSITIHVPGDPPWLLTGDTLFRESIGRTDLWGGDATRILRSIRDRLLIYPDASIVLPGHGPATTIEHERRWTPFLTGLAR